MEHNCAAQFIAETHAVRLYMHSPIHRQCYAIKQPYNYCIATVYTYIEANKQPYNYFITTL